MIYTPFSLYIFDFFSFYFLICLPVILSGLRNYPMFGKWLNALDKVLTFFEEWTLFIAVMVALISLFANVILRYGFNYALAWSEELVRLVIIYTTLIGCSAAVRNRSMIKIDASVQLLPKLKMPLTYFSNFTLLIFSVMTIVF